MEYQESYDKESLIDDEDAEMPSEESCERDSHFGDIVLDVLANIGAAQLFVGPSEEIRAGVTCWKLHWTQVKGATMAVMAVTPAAQSVY